MRIKLRPCGDGSLLTGKGVRSVHYRGGATAPQRIPGGKKSSEGVQAVEAALGARTLSLSRVSWNSRGEQGRTMRQRGGDLPPREATRILFEFLGCDGG